MSDQERWPYRHAEPEKMAGQIARMLGERGCFVSAKAQATIVVILAREVHGLIEETQQQAAAGLVCALHGGARSQHDAS